VRFDLAVIAPGLVPNCVLTSHPSRVKRLLASGEEIRMTKWVPEIGKLASGEFVFDRPRSHLHGEVCSLMPEVLAKVSSHEREILIEQVDLGRIVGQKICIETSPSDKIVYAQRVHRKGLTRFVMGREPEDCSSVVVILKRDADSETYVCLSAYIGTHSEPEPWDRFATPQSAEFWMTHALIWDGEEIASSEL